MNDTSLRGLALYAALLATFSEAHPLCDHILQDNTAAQNKTGPGTRGRLACAHHVATYTAGQTIAAAAVTTALGYRLPVRAWLAGTAINAATHYAIDRRAGFMRLLRSPWICKGDYLDHATAQRRPGTVDTTGPGTALYEMDQASHRAIGIAAAALTTWLALRADRNGR
ncbi:DUF3307 domain-containing protein [Actinomadura sp. WMMA1423]|uniref:DUF3307 domain-containing protein n=1 Tax=Actinomadura sp. WMMA1423 TaxID=2591108 RepID=UPI001147653A|nr:DUF3307 domain-containing protein [Actinomadura sp. WMMA1423]